MLTEANLQAIEEREKAATKGPWELEIKHNNHAVWLYHKKEASELICEGIVALGDAAFIAYARSDIPALIAEVKRLEMDGREERKLLGYKDDCLQAGVETIRQLEDELKACRELAKVTQEMLNNFSAGSWVISSGLFTRASKLLKELMEAKP